MNIKNPYKSPIDFEMSKYEPHILQHKLLSFDEGVKAALDAMKPKKFLEQLPEERQKIITMGITFSHFDYFDPAKMDKIFYVENGHAHTWWMPFPELD